MKEGKVYRYYVNNKPVRNKWKKINGKYYWFKSNGVAAHDGYYKVKGVYYVFDKYARRVAPGKKAVVKVNGVSILLMPREDLLQDGMSLMVECTMCIRTVNVQQMKL